MKQFHLLLRRRSAAEKAAQDLHGGRFQIGCEKKTAFIESSLEPIEEPIEVPATGGSRRIGPISLLSFRNGTGGASPFPSEKEDTLGEIERAELGVGLESHQHPSPGDDGVVETRGLGSEDHGDARSARAPGGDPGGGFARGNDRHGERTIARRGRDDVVAVGDGILERLENLDLCQDPIGIGSGGDRGRVRPSVARTHEPQSLEPAVEHRPGAHADVFPHLGLDENDDGLGID